MLSLALGGEIRPGKIAKKYWLQRNVVDALRCGIYRVMRAVTDAGHNGNHRPA